MNISIKKYSLIISLLAFFLPSFGSVGTADSLAIGQIFTLGKPTVKDAERKVMRYKYLFETMSTPKDVDVNSIEQRNGYLWEGEAPNSMHDWLNEFPTKTFYVDSVFSAQGINYALCYWIDERGMAYNEDAVDNKHYKNLYVLKNPAKAILVGEVVPSAKTYIEPMLIEEPARALTLFIKRTPVNNLAIGVLAFALLVFILNRFSTNRNLNNEIEQGLTRNISIDKLWKVQKENYWLAILHEKYPKHALKLRDWSYDFAQLQELNPTIFKKYGLTNLETISSINSAIQKVQEIQGKEEPWISDIRKTNPDLADSWAKWDADINKVLEIGKEGVKKFANPKEKFLDTVRKTDPQLASSLDNWEGSFMQLMESSRKIYIKHGKKTNEVDKLMAKYGGFESSLLEERDNANAEMIRLITSHIKA